MIETRKCILSENPGIYKIKCLVNNKCYIGSSVNLASRLRRHKHDLIYNKHRNSYLQRAFNKYGEENFEVTILELCPRDIKILFEKENYYCSIEKDLYNLRIIVESNLGIKKPSSEESRRKVSIALKGRIPKNLSTLQKQHRKKIAKYVDNTVVEIFDSCVDAAKSLGMKPNGFHQYIGKKLGRQKSKYFAKNTRYEYWKENMDL